MGAAVEPRGTGPRRPAVLAEHPGGRLGLVTSAMATRRGQSDMALGNVLGSNIFNLLFILGLVALISTVPLPAGGLLVLVVLLGITLLLFPMSISFDWTITRPEGGILLALYLAFMGFQLWFGLTRVGL